MKYIIMCGGYYEHFNETPKQLSVVNGEPLVARTIRLLKENGIKDIFISSNNPIFKQYGEVLQHENSYVCKNGKVYGYWLDAYYPLDEPCVYLHGDVYYSEKAIKTIIDCKPSVNTFIGNQVAKNIQHRNWGEPFGWIIVDQKSFKEGIKKTKKLQDEGKLTRGYAISWELYRVLNNLDPNVQWVLDTTYLTIADETIDIDEPSQISQLDRKIKELNQ